MSLTFYLDKGASLNPGAPCLTLDGKSLSYGEVVDISHEVAKALRRSGVRPGDKVGILSANDPTAFSCVFGIARAGAVWCPINPRNAAAENAELLDLFDCSALIFQSTFDGLVAAIAPSLPNPEATAEASAHGWHHTGDIGFLDDDDYLYIVDRAKDMVISGGFNVYSAEVEQALMAHGAVRDCAVIGLPDEKWGERVTAVVQPQSGAEIDTDELIAFVKQRIGSVKAPKQIEIWTDLPRSAVGKILKTEIRSRLTGN